MSLPKKNKKISVSVFCGAQTGNKKTYYDMAFKVGELLAKNNMQLVYGAGGTGLMGATAKGVLKNKGKILGITTKIIAAFEKPIKGTVTRFACNIQKRKRRFIDSSDAFIVLPGGFGTFDELFDLLVGKEIYNKHRQIVPNSTLSETRPIILINHNNFFKQFEILVDALIKTGFISKEHKKMYEIVSTPAEAIKLIKKSVKK